MSSADVFTIAELAVRWRVSRQTIMEAVHTGRLHAFKVTRRHYRVPSAEVERFEAERANQPVVAEEAPAPRARRVGGRS